MEESAAELAVHQRAVHDAFPELDDCDLGTMFESRAQTMKTVPQSSGAHLSEGNHVWVGPS